MAETIVTGVASRSLSGETVNGDAWTVEQAGTRCRVAVIDGLGHGPAAAEASNAARETLRQHPDLDPIEALAACHKALSRTRGASVSVAQIDPDAHRVTYAAVGNVETRLWRGEKGPRLMNYRGIVGVRVPTFRSFDYRLDGPWLLVMHSDGVSARFEISEVLGLAGSSPQSLAETILNTWGRETDDATVLVVAAATAFDPE